MSYFEISNVNNAKFRSKKINDIKYYYIHSIIKAFLICTDK